MKSLIIRLAVCVFLIFQVINSFGQNTTIKAVVNEEAPVYNNPIKKGAKPNFLTNHIITIAEGDTVYLINYNKTLKSFAIAYNGKEGYLSEDYVDDTPEIILFKEMLNPEPEYNPMPATLEETLKFGLLKIGMNMLEVTELVGNPKDRSNYISDRDSYESWTYIHKGKYYNLDFKNSRLTNIFKSDWDY